MARRVKHTKRKVAASHNSALGAKVEMRRWLVEQLGGSPRVLDCFCAAGMLWERAYDKTPRYLGLDIRQFDDDRRTIVCDSRRFLRHEDVDLGQFDLFDLDAFGSPLEHMAIIAQRLRKVDGRRVGFCLTDGTGFNSRMNGTPRGLLAYVGMAVHRGTRVQGEYRDEIFNRALTRAVKTAGLHILDTRGAGKAAGADAGMRYLAVLAGWR